MLYLPIVDDFSLMELDLDKYRNLFEVIDSRDCRKSTMIESQLTVKVWYNLFAENTYADACLDRMIHKAYRLQMAGRIWGIHRTNYKVNRFNRTTGQLIQNSGSVESILAYRSHIFNISECAFHNLSV